MSGESITSLEDLANEILYQIFEYLDDYHVYQALFHTNDRFRTLLIQSTLPIRLNLGWMSKSAFDRYNADVLSSNPFRIRSLRISNPFLHDEYSWSFSSKTSLTTIILEMVEPSCLRYLLGQLHTLPNLASLSITTLNRGGNNRAVYSEIFRLPALKYCQLSLDNDLDFDVLPLATDEHSSLEHLVLDDPIYLQQLDALLSYLPRLRRLCTHLSGMYDYVRKKLSWSHVLPHLTHATLSLGYCFPFSDLESLFTTAFPSIEVLCVSGGFTQLRADRWQQLLTSSLPKLRVFDLFLDCSTYDHADQSRCEKEVEQFSSSFWIERQYFFEYRWGSMWTSHAVLHSINPHRRTTHRLMERSNRVIDADNRPAVFPSVTEVQMKLEDEIQECECYFSNATRLTLEDGLIISYRWFLNFLSRTMPLEQLKTLIVLCIHLPFIKLLGLLALMPRVETMLLQSMFYQKLNRESIEQSDVFRSVSRTNSIKTLAFRRKCSLEKVEVLLTLCPRVQHLSLDTEKKNVDVLLPFLLNPANSNTKHLVDLCFLRADQRCFQVIEGLTASRTCPRKCLVKQIGSSIYLWW